MVAAMKLQLPSFVNVNEEKESEEPIEIEIDAGIELPSYLLIPESEDCLAESEECSDDEDLFTLSIAELESFINDNAWKNNLTGFDLSASFQVGCVPHYIQLVIHDGLKAMEVCYVNCLFFFTEYMTFFVGSNQRITSSVRQNCWWNKEERC